MRFTASLALAAAAVVPALAQSVTISATPLTQCATTTMTFDGSSGPYYVAVVPASDPCTEDAIAEFYDVESGSQDYYVNSPSGTSVQIYVMDVNGVENWSQIYTVGDGDNSCLGGSDAAAQSPSSSADPVPTTSTTDSATTSSTSAPALYVPPSPSTTAAAMTYANTNSGSTGDDTGSTTDDSGSGSDSDVAPANAASDDSANGASSLSASVTLLVGAFAAVVALF